MKIIDNGKFCMEVTEKELDLVKEEFKEVEEILKKIHKKE